MAQSRSTPELHEVVGAQLQRLAARMSLSAAASLRLRTAFELLTKESLARPAAPPFAGLSRINASGLPFQWSFCLDGRPPSVRFLCEAGAAGTSVDARYRLSLQRLAGVCDAIGAPDPEWLHSAVLPHVYPDAGSWPEGWHGAVWFALGARQNDVQLKVYLNLDHGSAVDRWKRVGWVLKALGRGSSLAQWCALSGRVSHGAWLVGIALDVRPDGGPGRVKTYFRSDAVPIAWLDKWYEALEAHEELRWMRRVSALLGVDGRAQTLPEKTFFVSVEFSARDEASLKTDLPVCRWMKDDLAIAAAVRRVLAELDLDEATYVAGLDALGYGPRRDDRTIHQLVGLGFEPDGTRHLNVYCEPPLPRCARKPAAMPAGAPGPDAVEAR